MNVIICKFTCSSYIFHCFCLIRYISTRSMILIMFVEKYTTIRSVFSKASDLPITIERLNSSTYIYATVKKNSGKTSSIWMFNFLYFTGNLIDFAFRISLFFLRSRKTSDYDSDTRYVKIIILVFDIVFHH
jgi:hypothetical protein